MINQQLVDEFCNIHRLTGVLGRGGQGVVYRTTDVDIALKLLTDKNGEPVEEETLQHQYEQRLLNIRLLPIPLTLNLSMPMARIKDKAGYIMPLLDDMIPLSSLLNDWFEIKDVNVQQGTAWLAQVPDNSAKVLLHYCRTGGLRRRMLLLAKCAATLARLHGSGLVYGDVSTQNIFVSKDQQHNEVWFIDADNLRFEIPDSRFVVYTPGFGAPELVQGKGGCTLASDCFAFAVVAFKLLSTLHPFEGELWKTQRADWAEQDIDEPEQAYAGLLPWIDDSGDERNRNPGGLPRELLLTTTLKNLFQQTFGEGRLAPLHRPCIFHWPQAFAQAADLCIKCPECNMSYMHDIAGCQCPYCLTPKPCVLNCAAYYLTSDKQKSPHCWNFVREVAVGEVVELPHRLFCDFDLEKADHTAMVLSVSDTDVKVKQKASMVHKVKVALGEQGCEQFETMAYRMELPIQSLSKGLWLVVQSQRPRVIHCHLQGAL